MALACWVSTSVTWILNSSRPASVAYWPSAFFSEPRWSMAAAAMTPRWFETALMPASFPGVIFMANLLRRGAPGKNGFGFGPARMAAGPVVTGQSILTEFPCRARGVLSEAGGARAHASYQSEDS